MSVHDFVAAFDFKESLAGVTIDLTHAHLWDGSAVAVVDKVVLKHRAQGTSVKMIGLNEASTQLLERLATYHKAEALPGGIQH